MWPSTDAEVRFFEMMLLTDAARARGMTIDEIDVGARATWSMERQRYDRWQRRHFWEPMRKRAVTLVEVTRRKRSGLLLSVRGRVEDEPTARFPYVVFTLRKHGTLVSKGDANPAHNTLRIGDWPEVET